MGFWGWGGGGGGKDASASAATTPPDAPSDTDAASAGAAEKAKDDTKEKTKKQQPPNNKKKKKGGGMFMSPKAVLSASIASALDEYFVVDADAVESNLMGEARIVLRDVLLRERTVALPGGGSATVTGSVREVVFSWSWAGAKDKSSASWVRDATLTVSGLKFKARLSRRGGGSSNSETMGEDEAIAAAAASTSAPHSSSGSGTSSRRRSSLDDARKSAEVVKEGGLQAYVRRQVEMIVDALTLRVREFEFVVEMETETAVPSSSSQPPLLVEDGVVKADDGNDEVDDDAGESKQEGEGEQKEEAAELSKGGGGGHNDEEGNAKDDDNNDAAPAASVLSLVSIVAGGELFELVSSGRTEAEEESTGKASVLVQTCVIKGLFASVREQKDGGGEMAEGKGSSAAVAVLPAVAEEAEEGSTEGDVGEGKEGKVAFTAASVVASSSSGSSSCPLIEPFGYRAEAVRSGGKRFGGDMSRGLRVVGGPLEAAAAAVEEDDREKTTTGEEKTELDEGEGEGEDEGEKGEEDGKEGGGKGAQSGGRGLVFHAGDRQIRAIGLLSSMLLASSSEEEEKKEDGNEAEEGSGGSGGDDDYSTPTEASEKREEEEEDEREEREGESEEVDDADEGGQQIISEVDATGGDAGAKVSAEAEAVSSFEFILPYATLVANGGRTTARTSALRAAYLADGSLMDVEAGGVRWESRGEAAPGKEDEKEEGEVAAVAAASGLRLSVRPRIVLSVRSVDQLCLPETFVLLSPVEDVAIEYEGSTLSLNLGSVEGFMVPKGGGEGEEEAEETNEESPKKSSETVSGAVSKIGTYPAMKKGATTGASTTAITVAAPSSDASGAATPSSSGGGEEGGGGGLALPVPFPLKVSLKSLRLDTEEPGGGDDDERIIVEEMELYLNPVVAADPTNLSSGKLTTMTQIALQFGLARNRLAEVRGANLCVTLPATRRPPPYDDVLEDLQFSSDSVKVAGGRSSEDWYDAFRPRKSREKRIKKGKSRSKSKKSGSTTTKTKGGGGGGGAATVYRTPHAQIGPLRMKVAYDTGVAGVKVKETSFVIKKFEGKDTTTTKDILNYHVRACMGRVPGFLTNAEVLGLNAADTATSTYGAWLGMAAAPVVGTFAAGGGGVAAVAGVDAVKGAVAAGKRARKAEEGEGYRAGDFVRGMLYAAEEAARDGKARRRRGKDGSQIEGEEGDEKTDVVDWAVGATAGVGKYADENKSRLGAAGGSGPG